MQENNKVGKPLKFKTVKEMQDKIDEYFAYCDNRTKRMYDEKKGQDIIISYPAPYTMSGLARALGIDRRTLLDYAHRDGYLPTIKAAREKIHEDVETRLMEGKAQAGAIFNLKNNFSWKDESKVEQSGTLEIVIVRHAVNE